MASVLVLTGPPGVGKTTVARLVVGDLSPSVHLHADDFWHFIRGGFVQPWRSEAHHQNAVVVEAVASSAVDFAAGGYDVVVDGIIGPWFLEPFRRRAQAAGVALHYVVLDAGLDVTLRRATARGDHGLTDPAAVTAMHQQFAASGDRLGYLVEAGSADAQAVARDVLARWRAGSHRLR